MHKSDESCEIAQKKDGIFVYNSKKTKIKLTKGFTMCYSVFAGRIKRFIFYGRKDGTF